MTFRQSEGDSAAVAASGASAECQCVQKGIPPRLTRPKEGERGGRKREGEGGRGREAIEATRRPRSEKTMLWMNGYSPFKVACGGVFGGSFTWILIKNCSFRQTLMQQNTAPAACYAPHAHDRQLDIATRSHKYAGHRIPATAAATGSTTGVPHANSSLQDSSGSESFKLSVRQIITLKFDRESSSLRIPVHIPHY